MVVFYALGNMSCIERLTRKQAWFYTKESMGTAQVENPNRPSIVRQPFILV